MADPLDESEIRHLDPKVRIIWEGGVALLALVVWLILSSLAPVFFTEGILGVPPSLYAALFLVIMLLLLAPYAAWMELDYRNYKYYISDKEIVIRKGVLQTERIDIPLEKVQDVHVLRTLPEKILDLATLKIETAGTRSGHAEGVLPGVGNYKVLIDEILEKVEQARMTHMRKPEDEKISADDLLREITALRAEIKEMRDERYKNLGVDSTSPRKAKSAKNS
ncbi:MAG: PH domain-containing protein [Candidatus Micrarchaeia archaeon]